ASTAGQEFLKRNSSREGVITLPSGLQYEVSSEGTEATPTASSTVRTHYEGTPFNCEVFDISDKRCPPAEFPVVGIIAGWTEARTLMKEGAKWRLYIPADLAYGGRAAGSIPQHSTLIFDIELLKVL